VATAALISCSIAAADTATITAVDAGGGQMTATVTATSTSCSSFGYCGWFTSVVERHSSLPCKDDDTFLREVQPLQENAGTLTSSFTFRPFFPRATKLCVIMQNNAGTASVGEAVITLPTGYGYQRSTAYNCSNFSSQAAAEYYLELYPGDPSRLDADHDGSACEDNKCPCGAESIPPEPEIPTTPVVAPPPAPAPPTSECLEAESGRKRAHEAVNRTRRFLSDLRGRLRPVAITRAHTRLRKASERLTKDDRWVEEACVS
jgi:hypothetical protein